MGASAIKLTTGNRCHQRLMALTADIKNTKLTDLSLVHITHRLAAIPQLFLVENMVQKIQRWPTPQHF
ncbi:MAG: hypothetical protein RLZZ158_1476 [Cyanobacteriota bacterium]|jgi:hypothetical protein